MIIIGVICLALANADKRGHSLKTFNDAKTSWAVTAGGGAKQFSNAFTAGPPSLTFTVGPAQTSTSFTLPMALSSQATALSDTGGDVKGCVLCAATDVRSSSDKCSRAGHTCLSRSTQHPFRRTCGPASCPRQTS